MEQDHSWAHQCFTFVVVLLNSVGDISFQLTISAPSEYTISLYRLFEIRRKIGDKYELKLKYWVLFQLKTHYTIII